MMTYEDGRLYRRMEEWRIKKTEVPKLEGCHAVERGMSRRELLHQTGEVNGCDDLPKWKDVVKWKYAIKRNNPPEDYYSAE